MFRKDWETIITKIRGGTDIFLLKKSLKLRMEREIVQILRKEKFGKEEKAERDKREKMQYAVQQIKLR